MEATLDLDCSRSNPTQKTDDECALGKKTPTLAPTTPTTTQPSSTNSTVVKEDEGLKLCKYDHQ